MKLIQTVKKIMKIAFIAGVIMFAIGIAGGFCLGLYNVSQSLEQQESASATETIEL